MGWSRAVSTTLPTFLFTVQSGHLPDGRPPFFNTVQTRAAVDSLEIAPRTLNWVYSSLIRKHSCCWVTSPLSKKQGATGRSTHVYTMSHCTHTSRDREVIQNVYAGKSLRWWNWRRWELHKPKAQLRFRFSTFRSGWSRYVQAEACQFPTYSIKLNNIYIYIEYSII